MPPRKDEQERVNPLWLLRRLMIVSGHLTPDLRETLIALFGYRTSFIDKNAAEAGRITFTAHPSQEQLARLCHIKPRGLARRLKRLQAAGVVSWEYIANGKGNEYTVILTSVPSKPDDATSEPPAGDPPTPGGQSLDDGGVSPLENGGQSFTGGGSVLSRTHIGSLAPALAPTLAFKKKQEKQVSVSQDSENQNPIAHSSEAEAPETLKPLMCEKCFRRPAAKGEDWCQRCIEHDAA